ncbi:hypothetical protein JCM5350_005351 [Sporobolomyces pararoseus]
MEAGRPSTAATVDSSATRVELTSTTCSPRAAALEPVNPIRRPRAGTNGTLDSAYLPPYFSSEKPPPLDFTFKLRNPILYLLFLLLCNVLIPCLNFSPDTNISDKELIGIGSASLGLSSCFDAPFRMYKLTRHRKLYGPLYIPDSDHLDPVHLPAGQGKLMRKLPRSWWHLDFTMWTYQIGLFFFAIPLAVAPAVPLYNFFLFSTAMLILPIGIVFLLTLKSWTRLPFWMSSDPPRTRTKPAVYYVLEDVGAVDFKHGRDWRKRTQARWAASPLFRKLCWEQTLFWSIASFIFGGIQAAIIWAPTPLDVAYGLVLGMLFAWMLVFGVISYLLVHASLRRELKWWKEKYGKRAQGESAGVREEMVVTPGESREKRVTRMNEKASATV